MKKLFKGSHDNESHSSKYIGRTFTLGKYSVVVEEVIAEGGFATVFQVKTANGQRFAMKRICVNDEESLTACKREIHIMVS